MSYIPQSIIAVQKPATQITRGYETITVFPTFFVPSDSEKTLALAIKWAGTNYTVSAPIQNNPFEYLRFWNIEQRDRGGRAYKVITVDNQLIDLREDIVTSVLTRNGVNPGGMMNASFVWSVVGGQTRLVNVGSPAHSVLLESTRLRSLDYLRVSDLTEGAAYRMKTGGSVFYVGRIKSGGKKLFVWQDVGTYGLYATTRIKPVIEEFEVGRLLNHVDLSEFIVNEKLNLQYAGEENTVSAINWAASAGESLLPQI